MIDLSDQHFPPLKSRFEQHAQGNNVACLISSFAFEVQGEGGFENLLD